MATAIIYLILANMPVIFPLKTQYGKSPLAERPCLSVYAELLLVKNKVKLYFQPEQYESAFFSYVAKGIAELC